MQGACVHIVCSRHFLELVSGVPIALIQEVGCALN